VSASAPDQIDTESSMILLEAKPATASARINSGQRAVFLVRLNVEQISLEAARLKSLQTGAAGRRRSAT